MKVSQERTLDLRHVALLVGLVLLPSVSAAALPLPSRLDRSGAPDLNAATTSISKDAEALGLAEALPPHRVFVHEAGRSRDAAEPSLSSAASRAASFLEAHPALRVLPMDQLELRAVKRGGNVTFVQYGQRWQGLEVLGGRLDLRLDSTGQVFIAGADVYFDESSGSAPRRRGSHRISETEAWRLASRAFPNLEPLVFSRAWMPTRDAELEFLAVVALRFRTSEPPGDWECWLDAASGELLHQQNRVADSAADDDGTSAPVSGSVSGWIEPITQGQALVRQPFPLLDLRIARGELFRTTQTDLEGGWSVDLPAGRYQRHAALRGRAVWVRNVSAALQTPFDTLSLTVPTTDALEFWDANAPAAARDAYYHATMAYLHARALDPGPLLAPLDSSLELRIEDASASCNAYWRGDYFNFFAEGRGCASTGRIADIVRHEYAHAVTQYCYAPLFAPTDLNEAFSDYFAASLGNDPRIGIGLRGPGTILRDIETDRVWPEDQHFDPHIQGLILAGALWDLRKTLGTARTDSLFHFARYGAAATMDDYLLDLLAFDDDDGDITNGTPSFASIIGAFRAHGIGDYSVRIASTPLPDLEDPPASIEASAAITSLLGMHPDSLAFRYSIDGGVSYARLAPVRDPETRRFRVELPAPPSGTTVRYYWTASDTAGHAARDPLGAPASTYSFYVGRDVIPPQIEHATEEFVTEEERALWLLAEVRDNSRLIRTVRAESSGRDTLLTPTRDPDLFEGWLSIDPVVPGDTVRYRLRALDGAGIPNEALLPLDGEFRLPVRAGRTERLETSDAGLAASGDWRWGVPAPEVGAYSGTRVWSNGLDAPYGNDRVSALEWGPLDLRALGRARLEFHHSYAFESGFDGGRVLISTDAGGSWHLLLPNGGYPTRTVTALGSAGYSGASLGWQRAEFPLDQYLTEGALLRFEAASDLYVSDRGWALDDLRIVQAQARGAPLAFRAEGGEDRRVRLAWQAPPGIDVASPRFLGYRVQRRELGEGAFSLLASPAAGDLQYVDNQVANGITYEYRLEASYDEGQSPYLLDDALPYAASLGVDVSEIQYRLNGRAEGDTTVFVRNLAGGNLRFRIYLAAALASLDDTRIRYPIPATPGPYVTIFADAIDAAGQPDLRGLQLRRREDPEGGPILDVRVLGHRPWGNPTQDWSGLLLLDTDGNLETSQGNTQFGFGEEINLGWEYGVLFGRALRLRGSAADAALFKAGDDALAPLSATNFPVGADSLSFSIPLAALELPTAVQLGLYFFRELGQPAFDRAPELPPTGWVDREPKSGIARVDHPQPFSVSFDARTIGNGDAAAALWIESNDPNHPNLRVPISLQVRGYIPDELALLELTPEGDGLRLRFGTPDLLEPLAARIERAPLTQVVWSQVGPDSLFPDTEGTFEWLDTEVEPGARYQYRFRVVFVGSSPRLYGPVEVRYDAPAPAALALYPPRPNPFSGTTRLRLDLPAAGRVQLSVYDLTGRRVATVLEGDLAAGTHRPIWNGWNDTGTELPAGRYWARVATAGGARSVPFLLLR